ncbi:MAG TPA: hypothetical protein VI076_09205 [Actinopolymorphaceae bacterium]
MRRWLKVAGVALLVVLILLLAQENATLTMGAVAGLVVAGLLWWWHRNPEAAAGVAALVGTFVATSEIATFVANRQEGVSAVHLGFAFWTFALVVAGVTWLAPRHRGDKAVTIALACALLIGAAFASLLNPVVVPPLGLAVAMVVVLWRSRPPRLTPRPYDPTDPVRLARGGDKTYDELTRLAEDDAWTLLGPRAFGRHAVEHLVGGPEVTYVVETRSWGGVVSLEQVGSGSAPAAAQTAYALDGSLDALTSRLAPIVDAVQAVRRNVGGEVEAVVVFWDDTELPDTTVALDVLGSRRRTTRVTLVRGRDLLALLRRRGRP